MAINKNDTATNISITNLGTGQDITTSVPNLSQTDLNNMYNARNDTNYTGTCTIVADTQALKRFTNQTNTNNIFESTLNEAIRIKAFIPPDEGTYSSKNDTLMDNMFDIYNDSTDANNDHLNIPTTLVKEVAGNRAVVLHVPTHSVVVTGYDNYRVTYRERYWSWFQYKYRYTSFDTVVFEVNNGWGADSNDKRFYPADAINNITTYGITKFID